MDALETSNEQINLFGGHRKTEMAFLEENNMKTSRSASQSRIQGKTSIDEEGWWTEELKRARTFAWQKRPCWKSQSCTNSASCWSTWSSSRSSGPRAMRAEGIGRVEGARHRHGDGECGQQRWRGDGGERERERGAILLSH